MVRFWRTMAARAAAALLVGLHLGAALAQPAPAIQGAEDPALQQAVAVWLQDDEGPALSALAGLAAQGNPAAQVLLGLIDKSPALQGPWLSRLSRTERLAVMRAPGGMSGRSWLAEAADQPIAAVWLALLHADAGPEVGAGLAALGEGRAAREALVTLVAREHPAVGADWHDWMDLELAFAVWPRAQPALRDRLTDLVAPTHPQRALMGLPVSTHATADGWDDWLAGNPAALPLRSLCAADCPDSQPACRRAALTALGSQTAALTLGSPVEALIPQETFLAAPRGRASVLRRILLAADARGRPALIARAAEADACLGARLAAEADRYRHVRNGLTVPDG